MIVSLTVLMHYVLRFTETLMALLEIKSDPDPILRVKAKRINTFDANLP